MQVRLNPVVTGLIAVAIFLILLSLTKDARSKMQGVTIVIFDALLSVISTVIAITGHFIVVYTVMQLGVG